MTNDATHPRHPIRVVALRTGLTPATIRAWERRYNAVEPARSDGGQRLYSDNDVDRLNTLRTLTDMGRSIGMVASMPPEAAEALLTEDLEAAALGEGAAPTETQESWVDEAYRHLIELDPKALERVLWRAFLSLGAKPFLEGVAAPLLGRVGTGWAAGRVTLAQEHLGSGVLERVLAWINDPSMAAEDGPRIVVATLQGERHALGARLAAATATVEGWSTTYLGADLPVQEIAAAANKVRARAVAISAVQTDRLGETVGGLVALRDLLDPEITIMVGGAGARMLRGEQLPSGIQVFSGLDGFERPSRNGSGA